MDTAKTFLHTLTGKCFSSGTIYESSSDKHYNTISEVFGNAATVDAQRVSEDGGVEFDEMSALDRMAMQDAARAAQASV